MFKSIFAPTCHVLFLLISTSNLYAENGAAIPDRGISAWIVLTTRNAPLSCPIGLMIERFKDGTYFANALTAREGTSPERGALYFAFAPVEVDAARKVSIVKFPATVNKNFVIHSELQEVGSLVIEEIVPYEESFMHSFSQMYWPDDPAHSSQIRGSVFDKFNKKIGTFVSTDHRPDCYY